MFGLFEHGISLDRLRSYDLPWYDQQHLLFAAAYAGKSRHTKAGERLAKKARALLRHEATNHSPDGVPIDDMDDDQEATQELEKRTAQAKRQINAAGLSTLLDMLLVADYPNQAPVPNIDAVLLTATRNHVREGTSAGAALKEISTIYETPPATQGGETPPDEEPFVMLTPEEMKRRLTQLSLVETELRDIFGADAIMSYKQINPLYDASTRELVIPSEEVSHEDTDVESSGEGSSLFTDYTFIVISTTNGQTYVVAESPHRDNACYVLRGDIVDRVGQLLGVELSWEDIMQYQKETARQLGAVSFNHGEAIDVVSKVADYSHQSAEATLKLLAQRWVVNERSAFDDTLQPTEFNRLPAAYRALVPERKDAIISSLIEWLGVDALPIKRALGKRALQPEPTINDVSPPESMAPDLQRENAELRQQLAAAEERARADQRRIERLKELIRELLDDA